MHATDLVTIVRDAVIIARMTAHSREQRPHDSAMSQRPTATPSPTAHRRRSTTRRSHDALPDALSRHQLLGHGGHAVSRRVQRQPVQATILLLATPTAAAARGRHRQRPASAKRRCIFAAAFLIFSGFAGYVSDRFSKRRVVVCCQGRRDRIMLLGFLGFLLLRPRSASTGCSSCCS